MARTDPTTPKPAAAGQGIQLAGTDQTRPFGPTGIIRRITIQTTKPAQGTAPAGPAASENIDKCEKESTKAQEPGPAASRPAELVGEGQAVSENVGARPADGGDGQPAGDRVSHGQTESAPQPAPQPAASAAFTAAKPTAPGQPAAMAPPAAGTVAEYPDHLRRGRAALGLPRSPRRSKANLAPGERLTSTGRILSVIRRLQANQPNPKVPNWKPPADALDPNTIPRQWKARVVAWFIEEQPEVPNSAIADLLAISEQQVRLLRKKIIQDAAWEIDGVDVRAMAAELAQKKRWAQRKAAENNDPALFWRIEKEYTEKMMELGFAPRAPIETRNLNVDVNGQLEEFINAFGAIPTPTQLLSLLARNRSPGNGNGTGSEAHGLPAGAPDGGGNGNGNGNGHGHPRGLLAGPHVGGHSTEDARGIEKDRPENR